MKKIADSQIEKRQFTNFLRPENLEKLSKMKGEVHDGFYGSMRETDSEQQYGWLLVTQGAMLSFGVEDWPADIGYVIRDASYWQIDQPGDDGFNSVKDWPQKFDWFAGEEICDVRIGRTTVTQICGKTLGYTYQIDSAVIFYFKTGTVSMSLEKYEWNCPLRLRKYGIGQVVSFEPPLEMYRDDDDDSGVERLDQSFEILSIDEAKNGHSNFPTEFTAIDEYTLSVDELFELQTLIGRKCVDVQRILEKDSLAIEGIKIATETGECTVASFSRNAMFIGGPWDGRQHFSGYGIAGEDNHLRLLDEMQIVRTSLDDFEFTGQKITKVEIVREVLNGKRARSTYKPKATFDAPEKWFIEKVEETAPWQFTSDIAVVFHFETGSLVLSRICYHNFPSRLTSVKKGSSYEVPPLWGRWVDLDVDIIESKRQLFTLNPGPWGGTVGPLPMASNIDEQLIAKGCTRDCTTKALNA